MALAACSGEDTTTTSGSAPSASTAASSAAPSASSAPSSAAADGTSDKKLCESAKKAGDQMKGELVSALQSEGGDVKPSTYKKILTDLNEKMAAVAAEGGDSKVAAALKQFGAEALKAAAAADPGTAAADPGFEKAGEDLTAACKAAGVTVKF
ncbi:hypothetical protein [Micromonospora sp. RTGN7]|uniref:hypothetical protein n=1 Tax=Micromonospora sp. RTGN7 TaxID=3016526 RepID=UPI0029FF3C86|nr:hypothetical protein [Micromonospora sp. RTGN7]